MTQPTWTEVPAARAAETSGRWRTVVVRSAVASAVGVGLWLLGLRVPAVVVLVAAAALAIVDVVNPRLAARVEHLVGRFGTFVGHVLGLVFLTVVNVLVFTPIAFVMWVFRHDLLAPGVRKHDASFWRAHGGRAMPRRQFSDERSMWTPAGALAPRRRPILRLATVVGCLSLVLLADLGAGWVYERVSDEAHGTAAVADDSFQPTDQPALRDSPWAAEMLAEQSHLPGTRDSFLGYRLGDTAGQYTNISKGERLTYRPSGSGRRVAVWFFGGSALFGDGQRDAHTIPSEFARIAESNGLLVDAHNYGRPATAVWQELELFEQLVSEGGKPDLVVFYDGFNDLADQLNVRLSSEPSSAFDPSAGESFGTATKTRPKTNVVDEPTAESGFSAVVGAYWDQSASHHVYDALDELFGGSDPPKVKFATGVHERDGGTAPTPDASRQAAQNAVSLHGRAATAATALASGIGAQTAFFWQPSVFTKRLLPEEQPYLQLGQYEPARWDPAVREARRLLKRTPYVDLGSCLDGATAPVLWDFVHTNEAGAQLSAQAIFDKLEPKLRRKLGSTS